MKKWGHRGRMWAVSCDLCLPQALLRVPLRALSRLQALPQLLLLLGALLWGGTGCRPQIHHLPPTPKDGALRTPSNLPQNPLVPNLELSLKGIASALHRLQLPAQRLALLPQPLLHLPPTPKQTP